MSDPVNVKGLRELDAALKSLPEKLEANVMRGGLRAGAKVIAEEAKANVPVLHGALRDSIRVGTQRKRGIVIGRVIAGGKGKRGGAYHAHLVEYGTKPHEIVAKKGKILAIGVPRVHHPGAKPRPFLRPAMDSQQAPAVEAMREYIRKRLSDKHGIDVPPPPEEGDE